MTAGAFPAVAQSEVKSAVDGAGTAINNQLGELFGVKKKPAPKRRAKPARPAAAKPAEAKPAEAKPAVTTAVPAVAPEAAVPLPRPRPFDGTPMVRPIPVAAPTPLTPPRPAVADVPLPPRPPIARAAAPRLAALPGPEAPAVAKTAPAIAALPPAEEAAPDEAAQRAAPSPPVVATICPELSNENLAAFTPVDVAATDSACTVDRGVRMSAVRMRDGRLVTLEPAAILRCEMAAAVANWLRDGVDPAVATLGSPLSVVMVAASQQCRSRNRVKGARISEHGRGNALDTRGYVLEDGRTFVIGRATKDAQAMPQAFQELLKASACSDFTTILGPGSDGYHEEHLHVDRAVRRSTVAMCQWIVGRGGGR